MSERSAAVWLVEVEVRIKGRHAEARRFAVASSDAASALRDVVHFPGLMESDVRRIVRRLDEHEARNLGLGAGAVRPYGLERLRPDLAITDRHVPQR